MVNHKNKVFRSQKSGFCLLLFLLSCDYKDLKKYEKAKPRAIGEKSHRSIADAES